MATMRVFCVPSVSIEWVVQQMYWVISSPGVGYPEQGLYCGAGFLSQCCPSRNPGLVKAPITPQQSQTEDAEDPQFLRDQNAVDVHMLVLIMALNRRRQRSFFMFVCYVCVWIRMPQMDICHYQSWLWTGGKGLSLLFHLFSPFSCFCGVYVCIHVCMCVGVGMHVEVQGWCPNHP